MSYRNRKQIEIRDQNRKLQKTNLKSSKEVLQTHLQSILMYSQIQTSSQSPKGVNPFPRVTFTQQMNYKQKASMLFDKLNSFKSNLQNQKYQKFSEVLDELKNIQKKLDLTEQEKQQHFDKVLSTLNDIDREINQQKIEFNRFKKILENLIESTSRQCQAVFDKMTKESQNNQLAITKFIDFKVESFVLKNKGVWLEQDLLNFQPFKEELNYLKKQVQQFYKNQQKEVDKLKKELSDSLEKQKEFLLSEIKRTDYDDLMRAIENVYSDITKKVAQMSEKRENVQKNVLSMIENVIDSYIKDSSKFK